MSAHVNGITNGDKVKYKLTGKVHTVTKTWPWEDNGGQFQLDSGLTVQPDEVEYVSPQANEERLVRIEETQEGINKWRKLQEEQLERIEEQLAQIEKMLKAKDKK